MSIFAWKHENITGIAKDIITHKLEIDRSYKPLQQKRKFAPKRNMITQEEVQKQI